MARVTVTRVGLALPRGMELGEREQIEFAGAQVQVRVTVPERAAGVERRSGKVAGLPLTMVKVVGPSAARAKSMAVPVRGTVCRPACGAV